MKYWDYYITVLLTCVSVGIIKVHSKAQVRRLNELIRHYEPVTYDHKAFHQDHHIAKRSTDSVLKLNFHAFGKHFPLRLKRDTKSMVHNMAIESGDGSTQHWVSDNAYRGVIEGLENSTAFGVVHSSGLFEGSIRDGDDVFTIEPSSRYTHLENDVYHTVIYKTGDIEYDKIQSPSMCESDELHKKLKDELLQGQENQKKNGDDDDDDTLQYQIHQDEGEQKYKDPVLHEKPHRMKRSQTQTQCSLYIQADHTYYEYWKTDEAVVNQITLHVLAVNAIYELIDFDGDGTPEGVNFIVKRIRIWRTSTETGYKFPANYDVSTYLQTFSTDDDFDDYCLAYMFTHRDFDGGTLGLAWTADLGAAGGVCERKGTFNGVQKALNAGLVSSLNYGRPQPQAIQQVTFAHELGHNFGSPHDQDSSTCAPGGDHGNYVMYAMANTGDKPNNNRFSNCSIGKINPVLENKAFSGCFEVPVTTICGNGVVESGEECDCGYDTDCDDTCCNPQVSSGTPVSASTTPCTLKPGKACSPSQGTCCNTDCSLKALSDNYVCREQSDCIAEALCDGSGATCPASNTSADGEVCSLSKVCQSGECTGSLCLRYSMVECQCEPATANNFKDEALCQLCCMHNNTSNDTCYSSYSLNGIPDTDVVGNACMDYEGICDVFHICRAVVPDGILSTIFSQETLTQWVKQYWYCLVIGGVVVIIGIVLMVVFCRPKKKGDQAIKPC